MKIFNFKSALLLGLALAFVSTYPADAQFFKKKKPAETIVENATTNTPSPANASEGMAIFKGGQPQEVKATSYYLKNGERMEKKPRRFFGLNRNKSAEKSAPQAPRAGYTNDTPTFDPVPTVPPAAVNSPSTIPAAVPVAKRGKRFGLPSLPNLTVPGLPKFGKKNQTPIDTSRAEVLLNNGGTLAPAGENNSGDFRFKTADTSSAVSRTKSPPRNDGGTVVYDSWDDVNARKVSAADEIVRDMKAQEAAHRRKIAAAKREHEERIKKAEADARIRAIMQGAVPPGGL